MTDWRVRSVRRAVVGVVLLGVSLGLSLVLAAAAHAHAELVGSSPRDGERLERAPHHVVLEFTERVQLVRDGIRLLDGDGRPVPTPAPRVDGSSVVLPLPPDLPTGGYLVSWRVISTDTHPVAGAFGFGIRSAAVSSAGADAEVQVAAGVGPTVAVLRWVSFGGVVLLFGGAAFLLLCWPAGRELCGPRRLVWIGWAATTAAVPFALAVHGLFVSGAGFGSVLSPRLLGDTLSSQFGLLLVARLVLLAALVLVLRPLLRPEAARPTWALVVAGVLAFGVVLTFAGTGHSASGEWRALALASDAVHLSAMSLWAGGLVFLAFYALRPRHIEGLGGGVVRFSRLATGVVVVLVVTGTFQAWRTVGSFGALLTTTYGQIFLAKLATVLLVFAIGGLSNLVVRRSRPESLRRTVPFEAALVAVVLAITSVLVITAPARQAGPPPVVGPQRTVLALPGGDTVHLELTPAAVGANTLHITVHAAGGGLKNIRKLTARATLPARDLGPLKVTIQGSGAHCLGEVSLPFPATWRFDLTVHISELDAYVVSANLPVGTTARR